MKDRYEGSLRSPLFGCGDKKGESVSKRSLSIGTDLATSINLSAFENVIGPAKDIYSPNSIHFLAVSFVPLKQCTTPFNVPFLCLSNILKQSSLASREWIITGRLLALAK